MFMKKKYIYIYCNCFHYFHYMFHYIEMTRGGDTRPYICSITRDYNRDDYAYSEIPRFLDSMALNFPVGSMTCLFRNPAISS